MPPLPGSVGLLGNFANILLAAVGISFLIFIHELGHYLAARLFKVRVEVFSLGFGPRLLGFQRGGTDYRLSAVPLGGYVKMAGEYADLRDDQPLAADDLTAKPPWQRAVIFSAGVIVNFAFAFLAFPLAFRLGVPFVAPVLGGVVPGGPAWTADLQPGDEVLAVDGHDVYGFPDVALEVALADPSGTRLRLRRDGREFEQFVVPARNLAEGRNEIGIVPAYGRLIAVGDDTPAHDAGLRTGDEIVAVDGQPLSARPDEIADRLLGAEAAAGTPLTLTVLRDGERIEARVEPRQVEVPDQRLLGVMPMITRVSARRGAATRADFPLRVGDVVLTLDGESMPDGDAITAALAAAPAPHTARLRRGGEVVDATLDASAVGALLDGDIAWDIDDGTTRVRMLPGGALAAAGLRDGDEILAVDGTGVSGYRELQAHVRDGGPRFVVKWRSGADGEVHTSTVDSRPVSRPDYGFSPQVLEVVRKEDLFGAIRAGTDSAINMLRTTWLTLTRLFTGQVATSHLGGIVSISVLTYQFAEWGLAKLLSFLALLSINLGFINILPVPVLDGGQIVFLVMEAVKGRRLSERFLNGMQLAGLVFILALVLYVTYNDIVRLVG